jgi:mycothiol synthase
MQTEILPRGFVARHPVMSDAEAVARLAQICEIELYGEAESTLDDLLTEWHEPDYNLATDAWIVLSPDGEVVGANGVGHREHVRIYTGCDVHPNYRNRGIGTYLLKQAEARAYQHMAEAVPGVRVTLNTGVNSKNSAAQRLLEQHGFKQVRTFWRMLIEMNEAPPTPTWAEGITVRTFAPGMERAVFEADEEAFRDHWGYVPGRFEEWEHWTVKREGFDPSLWFLAMDGDEVAGFAFCKDEGESSGWVHVLGVRRPWRRKGIGLALLHSSFSEFYRRGIYKVYLGVDAQNLTGATRLYKRAGMHVIREGKNYEKELRAGKEISTQFLDS